MDIRVGGDKLVAPGGLPFTRDEVELRRLKPGVTEERVMEAIRANNRDEVLFRSDAGELFVISAGKLQTGIFGFPQVGERVKAGAIEGTVTAVDDERNLAHTIASVALGATALAPVAGYAYAVHAVHSAGNLAAALGLALVAPFNFLIGTVAAGTATIGAGAAAGVAHDIRTDRAAESLDDLTEKVG